jgi:hypothetical protein
MDAVREKQWVNTHRSPVVAIVAVSRWPSQIRRGGLAALLDLTMRYPLSQSLMYIERQPSEHVDAPKRR